MTHTLGRDGLPVRPCQGWVSATGFVDLSSWIEPALPALCSPAGALAFMPLYALWVTVLLPGVWPTMLAGALYGSAWGTVLVYLGAVLGAELTFLLARHRLRGWSRRRLAALPKGLAIERAVSREGLRLVLLTRLSPAFPFSLLNLAYGVSDISRRDFSLGLLGILPGTVLFCALGELAGDVSRFGAVLAGGSGRAGQAVSLLGIVATVAAMVVAGRATRRALERQGPP